MLSMIPIFVLGADVTYVPLVGIPGLEHTANTGLPEFINRIYFLLIAVGCLIGVVKIAFAGVKWSLDDIVTHKSTALEEIKGVLLGLFLLVIPYVILDEINPNLTNLDVLTGAPKVKVNLSEKATQTQTTNTAEQLAVDRYVNNSGNTGNVKSDWKFVGVTRDFCNSVAKERGYVPTYTQTGASVGVCELYPNL
jgi:hypothetical protein